MSSNADGRAERFVEAMSDARAWRKKEISELVQALSTTEEDSQLNETLRRALALLLNAHWEALVKLAVDEYLRAAKSIGAAEKLPEGIAFSALAMERAHRDASNREQRRLRGKLTGTYPMTHPLADVLLLAESNAGSLWHDLPDEIGTRVGHSLWWNRLEYLCGLVDVPVPSKAGDSVLINERVVKVRHQIAHGDQLLPDHAELLDARDRVLELIDGLIERMEDSLFTRRFAE